MYLYLDSSALPVLPLEFGPIETLTTHDIPCLYCIIILPAPPMSTHHLQVDITEQVLARLQLQCAHDQLAAEKKRTNALLQRQVLVHTYSSGVLGDGACCLIEGCRIVWIHY